MNKIISTKERFFVSLVGPSGSGKSLLIHEWLTNGIFQPEFDNFLLLSTISISLWFNVQRRKKIDFIKGVDFEFIQILPNNGTKYLLIFDDSCH